MSQLEFLGLMVGLVVGAIIYVKLGGPLGPNKLWKDDDE